MDYGKQFLVQWNPFFANHSKWLLQRTKTITEPIARKS